MQKYCVALIILNVVKISLRPILDLVNIMIKQVGNCLSITSHRMASPSLSWDTLAGDLYVRS